MHFVRSVLVLSCVMSACSASLKNKEQSVITTPSPVRDTMATSPSDSRLVAEVMPHKIQRSSVLSLPDIFAFSICREQDELRSILGLDAIFKVEAFEGGEDYEPYSVCRLTYGETQCMEYSYSGMHEAYIDTPLLPLKHNIKVGMTKKEFLEKMQLKDVAANEFELTDDYGSVSFVFVDNVLMRIIFYYEYGT